MTDVCRYKFLVLDDAHWLESRNLQRKVSRAVKHPEPVTLLDAPWDTDKSQMFSYNNVLYDHEEKLFRMWYSVCGKSASEYWERGVNTAYATSTDGIHWDKPVMNLIEVRGSRANNYIFPSMLNLAYTIISDPSDAPTRRYKMIFMADSDEQRWAGHHIPLNLAYSADGITWDRPQHVNPILRGISDAGWGFIYDPDRRKYQLYTRRVPNLPRDISLYESSDLVNWEDKGRVLVPGDEYDPPEMFNFQGMAPFFYEDFCLGLLNTQYTLPESETYEVFHDPPADWPTDRLGQVDVQLAYSRDGVRWSRPDDRSPIIPNGESGAPDEGVIFVPSANPFVIDGQTYIYYSAGRYRHNDRTMRAYMSAHDDDVRGMTSCMLAKVPEDRFLALEAGIEEGFFTTRPWGPPHEVFVNADARSGAITCELITPYGEPVPGYTRSDCIPVTGDGIEQRVQWKGGGHPWDMAAQYRGGVLIRFYLKNAKLYSYSFTLPDPDGSLQRQKANARWCDYIKHRCDQWGQRSNEPAGGVPAHADTTRHSLFD